MLIFVAAAALICAAHSGEKIDYGTVKLRHVDAGQGGERVDTDGVAASDDNKARIAQIWGVELRPSEKDATHRIQQLWGIRLKPLLKVERLN